MNTIHSLANTPCRYIVAQCSGSLLVVKHEKQGKQENERSTHITNNNAFVLTIESIERINLIQTHKRDFQQLWEGDSKDNSKDNSQL